MMETTTEIGWVVVVSLPLYTSSPLLDRSMITAMKMLQDFGIAATIEYNDGALGGA